MATFTGQLISATYDAIIKTIDNDAIGSTAKQLTDGLGNVTPLYVSNTQIGIGITPTEALDVSGNIKASLSVIATTFSGDLNGTINTATTGVTQTVGNDTTKIATTAFVQESHVGKPTGSGTGGKIALWSGSGSSTVLTDSSITEESTQYLLTKDIRIFDPIPAITLQDSDSSGSASLGDIQWLDNAASQRAIISLNNAVLGIMSKHGGLTLGTNSSIALSIDGSQNAAFTEKVTSDSTISTDGGTTLTTKDYVDSNITAQDLDFSGTSGTGSVDLDSQTFAVIGTANEIETSAGSQQLQIGLPDDVTIGRDLTVVREIQTFSLDVTAGASIEGLAVTGDSTFSGTITAPTFIGDLNGTINTLTTATTQSASNNSTKVATTAYADAAASAIPIGDYLPLAGGTLTGGLTGTSATFAGIITANSSSSGDYVRMYGSSGTGKWDIYGNGANLRISDNESAGILAVDTGATFAGNVGIGVTPEAWAVFKPLQIGQASAFVGRISSNQTDVATNFYYDGAEKRITTGYAQRYTQTSDGKHQFWTAGTDSADSTITFSQKFEIANNGDSTFAGNVTTEGGLNITGTNNTTSTLTLTNTAPTPDNSWSLTPQYNSQDLHLLEDTTTQVTFKSGGNVIIGDTTATSPNSADRFLKIGKSNLQDCSIILQDAVETWEIYQNDNLSFSYGTTPTTVLTLARTTGAATFAGTKGSGENLNLVISDTTTGYAAGTGGSILFQGIFNSNNNLGGAAAIQASKTNSTNGDYSYDLDFYTRKFGSAIEKRMRITSGGDVFVGTDSTLLSGARLVSSFTGNINNGLLIEDTISTGTANMVVFTRNGVQTGAIEATSSATAYVTSSDYRLKENVAEMTGALDRVSELKPSRFNFIADADKTVDGFLAHEVQDIVPEAITGEKDAMQDEEYEVSPAVYEDVLHPAIEEELDEDGNIITEAKEEWTENVLKTEAVKDTRQVPDYQGIDQSKLVPLLVGAIQELKAEIDLLKQECKCK